MQQDKSPSRSGQSLVEAMVAISLLLVGFLGTITLINRSIGLTRVVADNYVGTYLAAEGIEVVKNLIDANYIAGRPFSDGFALCTTTCDWELEYDSTWESNAPTTYADRTFTYDPIGNRYAYGIGGNATTFKRKVSVTLGGASGRQLLVTSRVEWLSRGGGTSAVALEDRFYDWYLTGASAAATSTDPSATSSTSTTP
jgi:hypothetical protein